MSVGIFLDYFVGEGFGVLGIERGNDWKGVGKVIVRALGGWENKVTVTDVEDVGKCTAELC